MDPAREQSAIQLARHLTATAGKRVNPICELLPVKGGIEIVSWPW